MLLLFIRVFNKFVGFIQMDFLNSHDRFEVLHYRMYDKLMPLMFCSSYIFGSVIWFRLARMKEIHHNLIIHQSSFKLHTNISIDYM